MPAVSVPVALAANGTENPASKAEILKLGNFQFFKRNHSPVIVDTKGQSGSGKSTEVLSDPVEWNITPFGTSVQAKSNGCSFFEDFIVFRILTPIDARDPNRGLFPYFLFFSKLLK